MSNQDGGQVPLMEPVPIQDTFVSRLVRVEVHGSVVHFILGTDHTDACGNAECVISARIVMPKEAVPAAVRMALQAVSNDFMDRRLWGVRKFAS